MKIKGKEDKMALLERYVPIESVDLLIKLQSQHNFNLKITKARMTKLGDYRPPNRKKPYHSITVNHDLNPYAFLITLIHEIAHLFTWESFNHKVKPHGKEWKINYQGLLNRFLELGVFPKDIIPLLNDTGRSGKASNCTDETLLRSLRKYDKSDNLILEEIDEGSLFVHGRNRVFRKGAKRRKRFICLELATEKKYLFSGLAVIKQMEPKD